MKSIYTFWVVLIIGLHATSDTLAQGCSDAGVCSINSIKPGGADTSLFFKNQLKLGAFMGAADHSIAVYGAYIDYSRVLNRKLSLDIKLTTLAQSGNGIATFGLSDVFIDANYSIRKNINLTAGFKFPLSKADKVENNLPLPMDYQSSLGTIDILLGLSFTVRNFQFALALQQPLTQNNNAFLAAQYPINSPLRTFQSTNAFERRGDLMLRASYPIHVGRKLRITPGLLPIYHLQNDAYTDLSNTEIDIEGSQGLTLNGNLFLDYQFSKKSSLQFNAGLPFIVRDARPDGLTRRFIAGVEYRVFF